MDAIWIQITWRLNRLEGSDDFACVYVEFPLHVGYP